MQGSEATANPQQSATGLQANPEQQLQNTGEGTTQAASSDSSVLQSPASSQQAQLFLRGETAGQKVSGDGDFMPPSVVAILGVLGLVVLVLAATLLVQRLRNQGRQH